MLVFPTEELNPTSAALIEESAGLCQAAAAILKDSKVLREKSRRLRADRKDHPALETLKCSQETAAVALRTELNRQNAG